MMALVVAGGAAIACGLLLMVSGVRGQPHPDRSQPVSPPSGSPRSGSARSAAARAWVRRHRRRCLAAAVAAVLVLVGTGWPAAALAAAAGCLFLPPVMTNRRVDQRLRRLDAIEQWVRRLSALLGASRGLEDALKTSAQRPPGPIAAEVDRLAQRLRGGMDPVDALYRLAEELDDPVGDLVVAALVQAAEIRGRGVQQVLTGLAGMVAEDVAGRRTVEAERAPHRATVRGVAAIFIVFGAGLALRPDYSAAYNTPAGQLVLAGVLGVCAAGLLVMYRLAHQPPVGRFLHNPTSPDQQQQHRQPSKQSEEHR